MEDSIIRSFSRFLSIMFITKLESNANGFIVICDI